MPGTDAGTIDVIERLRLRAPAKINLALHVTGRRPDGYHLLDSLVVFTRFGDELEIAPAAADSFEVEGPFAKGIPTDGSNLVIKARDAFRQVYGNGAALALRLAKNLPPASGIGGGSSDAAACLAGMARAGDDLAGIGLRLGADLPMCLAAEPLRARGIGELIDPLPDFPALSLVLANPGVEVPTSEIFRRLSSPDNAPLPGLPQSDVVAWLRATRNDLQEPAIAYAPQIGECLRMLERSGAAFTRMSGSGATCFGVFTDFDAASRAAERMRAENGSWFVTATQSHASGTFRRRIEP
ncbi:4-(cytidine 5'-diphospho)-2-C-methyl-D-erythritol kinase [Aliihoeflea sp. 40Bstr573]|uniref:4-(cytidine 5'-diphospho)-2-C-methyl-D-erythritol kinase n=1 Tax=Aliihoeflea sp. 40Bstr573 TaxID=2696467 RepID=UPI002094FCDC|nr:4-(cytidine 5'-diphospho)-2-C-methyl-D-erythritol kinase [Aliihoeflea sp. 40Bstr573]